MEKWSENCSLVYQFGGLCIYQTQHSLGPGQRVSESKVHQHYQNLVEKVGS